jgi:hypothetical protein
MSRVSCLAMAAGLAASGAAMGQFSGPYAPPNWTFTANGGSGSVDTSGAPASITLTGNDNGGSNINTDYTIAGGGGFLQFHWEYTSTDSGTYDAAYYLVNGTQTLLATNSQAPASGDVSVPVGAGDVIGFRVSSVDGIFGPGVVTISNFSLSGTPPTGRCCLGDGTCIVVTQGACNTQGGTYGGNGTDCSASCPQPGRCCFFGGTCSLMMPAACAAAGGAYTAGQTCQGDPCPGVGEVIFANCSLSTGAATLSGAAAPAGASWSEVPRYSGDPNSANGAAGFAAGGGVRLADDFTVGAGGAMVTYARLPVYTPGATAPTVTGATLRIWNGPPGAPGSSVIFGDATTNRLANGSFSNMYRTFNTVAAPVCGGSPTAPTTGRRIQYAYLNVNQTLPAGTYWLDWDITGGMFAPAATNPTAIGSQCTPGANAMQFNGVWGPLVDPGQGCAPAATAQDLYFELLGTAGQGQACYANCNHDTSPPFLNVLDFTCFLNKFAAGDPYANCDGSTAPPELNVLDFSCFLNKFSAGCSAP